MSLVLLESAWRLPDISETSFRLGSVVIFLAIAALVVGAVALAYFALQGFRAERTRRKSDGVS
jgi:hypothetical protein